ncbi:hypothetical protein ABE522_03535 [Stenotrophomonas pennii]|uniref:hypothetical protein n=1 Tax=Stenotrophomonas lacuserhaii TaxID=2760084 RepID=UPI003208D3D6
MSFTDLTDQRDTHAAHGAGKFEAGVERGQGTFLGVYVTQGRGTSCQERRAEHFSRGRSIVTPPRHHRIGRASRMLNYSDFGSALVSVVGPVQRAVRRDAGPRQARLPTTFSDKSHWVGESVRLAWIGQRPAADAIKVVLGAMPWRCPADYGTHEFLDCWNLPDSSPIKAEDADMSEFRYAYGKLRRWHVGTLAAICPAIRYALTGDTGSVRSHGGWMKSRLRSASQREAD